MVWVTYKIMLCLPSKTVLPSGGQVYEYMRLWRGAFIQTTTLHQSQTLKYIISSYSDFAYLNSHKKGAGKKIRAAIVSIFQKLTCYSESLV